MLSLCHSAFWKSSLYILFFYIFFNILQVTLWKVEWQSDKTRKKAPKALILLGLCLSFCLSLCVYSKMTKWQNYFYVIIPATSAVPYACNNTLNNTSHPHPQQQIHQQGIHWQQYIGIITPHHIFTRKLPRIPSLSSIYHPGVNVWNNTHKLDLLHQIIGSRTSALPASHPSKWRLKSYT